jgi:putative flippase GtrA
MVLSAQFLRFVLAGGVAAAANYGSRFLFSAWLPYPAAITCAYLVGMAVAFALMRQYVFSGAGQPMLPQVAKFAIVNLLALLQTLVVSLVLARWVLPAVGVREHVEAIAHLVGVAVPVFTSFVGHRQATFRRPPE